MPIKIIFPTALANIYVAKGIRLGRMLVSLGSSYFIIFSSTVEKYQLDESTAFEEHMSFFRLQLMSDKDAVVEPMVSPELNVTLLGTVIGFLYKFRCNFIAGSFTPLLKILFPYDTMKFFPYLSFFLN